MIHTLRKLFFKYKLFFSVLVITIITNLFIISKLYIYIENNKKGILNEHFYSNNEQSYDDTYRKKICHIHKSDCRSLLFDDCPNAKHCHFIPYCGT